MLRAETALALWCIFLLISGCTTPQRSVNSGNVTIATTMWQDQARGDFPVEILRPTRGKTKGLILFSHGAFSAPEKYRALTRPWAAAGYVVVAPLHADSESWSGAKPERAQQSLWRMADMQLSPQRIAALSETTGEAELNRLPLIAAGHSLGALIAQMHAMPGNGGVEHSRPKAVIAFSPPPPIPGVISAEGWAKVTAPQMIITGTADILPPFVSDWRLHLASFEAATAPAFAFVAADADHYFGSIIGRTEYKTPPQQAGFDRAVEVSLLFLKAYARNEHDVLDALTSAADLMVHNVEKEGARSAKQPETRD